MADRTTTVPRRSFDAAATVVSDDGSVLPHIDIPVALPIVFAGTRRRVWMVGGGHRGRSPLPVDRPQGLADVACDRPLGRDPFAVRAKTFVRGRALLEDD
ncbi:hypothetical protein DVR14_02660 [Natrinema thermotolerans]|nr:hypothetical protein DVR14_02660 [Natrinema thermotolerans]